MKFLKNTLKVLLVLVIIIGIGLWIFSNSLKPTYDGNLKISSLQDEVTVYYDTHGIPHIYAENQVDAQIALGYVHAQDRLWQMELMRRIAPGRLSEIIGDKTIETDKFFAGLGIEEHTAESIAKLDKNNESYKLAMAYLDGVNQFIENGPTPIEYHLLGLKKEPFQLEDMYNVFGYMSFSFAMAHKTDPLLSQIQEKLGNEYLKELGIDVSPNSQLIHNHNPQKEVSSNLTEAVSALLENLPVSPFIGSNSWVVGPQKTKNGKVIFENDPHIAFSQPSVWYQAHITTPDYEMYGFYLALTPYPLLGHNRHHAFGLTMFENDDIDFFKEENEPDNPLKYKTETGYSDYVIRNKTIKVKDADDINFELKVSRHGPIMNDLVETIENDSPVAMDWVYTKFKTKIFESSYLLTHAKNINEFKKGVALIHAPGLNVMYGDADNNIGWWATGKLYKRGDSSNTKLIMDGVSGANDISKYLDFSQNPQAINPSWNYVYSANNQPDSIAGSLYPGYYLPEDRASRIVQLLEAKNDWTKESIAEMTLDVTSSVAPTAVQNIIAHLTMENLSVTEKEALASLQKWNGAYELDAIAPTVYTKLIYVILENTFADELGEKGFEQLINTHLQKRLVATQIANEASIWWDNTSTESIKENRSAIFNKSFKEAISLLTVQLGSDVSSWNWKRVHTIEHKHLIGEVATLRDYFNVGPFEISGTNEVINNQLFNLTENGEYKVKSGPSTRRIIDFSDIENSLGIIPTGQSGNPFSKYYKDQAQLFVDGKFVPMMLNKQEIINTADGKLIFTN